ncbi:MAG: HAMP domain-containing protein [Magnetococcales bacterium]|nr:HAMP domain-containing protein [Magnetococcales bacterium]
MRLSDIPIKQKLMYSTGFCFLLFCTAVLFYTLTLRETITGYEHLLDHEIAIRQHAGRITQYVLRARKDEKDFLTRKDPAHAQGTVQNVRLAIQEAKAVEPLIPQTDRGMEIKKQLLLTDHLERYEHLFQTIVAAWETRGLDHEHGQQKTLRDAAHALEQAFRGMDTDGKPNDVSRETIPGAQMVYLTLRRLEKDYLLRQEESYLPTLYEEVQHLRVLTQQSTVSEAMKEHLYGLLATYLETMKTIATTDDHIQQTIALMRTEVHQTEPLVAKISTIADELAAAAATETRRVAEERARLIFFVSLGAIVICGWLTYLIVRSIVSAIANLWHFSHEVAGGNLEAKTTLDSRDEIGQLAVVMREMVNRMRAMRLIADRMVMIMTLAARGAIPDPLDAKFQGDFQKMCGALNDMIQRLQELRLIADHVDRISRGEIPLKLDGQFQGDFKRMVDAINIIIDQLSGRQA